MGNHLRVEGEAIPCCSLVEVVEEVSGKFGGSSAGLVVGLGWFHEDCQETNGLFYDLPYQPPAKSRGTSVSVVSDISIRNINTEEEGKKERG